MDNKDYKNYWETNIARWGDLYLDISHGHEEFSAPKWMSAIYNKTIVPYEAFLMKKRYLATLAFIDRYVHKDTVFCDIGCGTGIFVVHALKKGAMVKAMDFAEPALEATRKNVEKNIPNAKERLDLILADAEKTPIPPCDIALAMGVTPYIKEIERFYANILPYAQRFCCLVVDDDHYLNRLRRRLPFLNVRNLQFYSKRRIDSIIENSGHRLIARQPFATGFIDISERKNQGR